MIDLAEVKFHNPYSSLHSKGYKTTPAILKISLNDE